VWHYIPEDNIVHDHCSEKVKSNQVTAAQSQYLSFLLMAVLNGDKRMLFFGF
jgi:hypothetical protein